MLLCVFFMFISCEHNTYIKDKQLLSSDKNFQNQTATYDFSENFPAQLYGPAENKRAYCVLQESEVRQNRTIENEVLDVKSPLLEQIYLNGLTEAQAVQLALVNNPELLAFYNNLNLGYAEFIEAGLRQNPNLSSSIRIPDEPLNDINRTFDGVISYLDNFLIPIRQRAAAADVNVIEAQIKEKVLKLARDVQIYWLQVKSLELLLDEETKRVQLKEIAAKLADLQMKAGNISELHAKKRELDFEQALERLKNIQVQLEGSVELLSRTLGLFGPESCFRIVGDIDWKNDIGLPDVTAIENAAINNRADIEVIRREVTAIAEEAKLVQPWTYSNIKIGISKERELDGVTVTGPLVELELPIYNYGQGQEVKYLALLNQSQKRLLAKAIEACSEVREFFKAVNVFHSQIHDYEVKILPAHKEQVSLAQAHYNVMTIGIYELLDIKEKEIEASIEQLMAIKNYEQARIELFHAAGGSFASIRTRQ